MPKRTIITAEAKRRKRMKKTIEQRKRREMRYCGWKKQRIIDDCRRSNIESASGIVPSTSYSSNNRCVTDDSTEHFIGTMNVLCVHCNAKHFAAEKVSKKKNSFNDCCSHGEVRLEPLPSFPHTLLDLFNGTNEESKHFYDRIRCYNSTFAFASFNINLINFNNHRPGPFCFKIQGQIYYQINTSLYPSSEESPSFGQLLLVDANEAIGIRSELNSQLNTNVIQSIEMTMRECNVFAQSYQMMRDELELMKSLNDGREPELQLLFSLKPGMNPGRFNSQRSNEVAAIFSTTADGEIPESYVTIRNIETKKLQYVSTMDPNVEPWVYPLFFPYGTRGWHCDISCINKERRVTRNAYVKYRIAIRDDFNVFLMGRRLFQQWVVDNYVKIEKDRISYCKRNQVQLRVESYQGLIDHLAKRAGSTNSRVGKMIILPSTFIGSPRNMLQLYQDAMAIVRKYGKPDLFITMTCNPNWREIKENLFSGQTAADRPDLVARVFEIKKNELIDLIVRRNHFGEVLAYVYVIEYQKRGLPHVHLLVTLKPNSKITTPNVVDKYITAEIPNPDEYPLLHDLVMKNMIHDPCGDWCLVNNKCSKHYPKQFREETWIDENGQLYYQRRNTGKVYKKLNNFNIDNRYIVPYNKYLLLFLNCHINVEIVSSLKSVKYLYKYIYKGHDATAINITESDSTVNVIEHDEIREYIETRYVGPVEACWRILNKRLHAQSHSIIRLPVHLPDLQNVIVHCESDEEMLRDALIKQTMLIDYFDLNKRDDNARNLTYTEIPSQYVFKKKKDSSCWERRKAQFNVIGRMYSISPSQTELFHLRLLLVSVKGAKSFVDLRTVNGKICNTYVSACLALGLIEDDNEWQRAMHEAEIWMMPRQLRSLFVRILIYCQPIHPEELWNVFKDAMSQDFARQFGIDEARKKAYIQINTMLIWEGSSLSSFPNMEQITEIDNFDYDNSSLDEHRNIGVEQYEKLNVKQKEVFDTILKSVMEPDVSSNTSHCFYIDGPGGSGKTFIYTTLCHVLKSKGKKVCTMAFTGIAATLLPNGRTVHKTFGMPVPLFADSTSNIKNQSKESDNLKDTDLFIWDEAPMSPRYALELVNRTLRDIMNNDLPFGGKTIVLGGDFRQLLPVKINATRSETVNLSIKFSSLWNCFVKFALTENMRTLPEEVEFTNFLLSIGNGNCNDEHDNTKLPDKCIAPNDSDIVYDVYGKIIMEGRFDDLSKSAILSARNIDVEDINIRVVDLLDKSSEHVYTSINDVENCNNGDIDYAILPEYLNTLNPANFPPHELRLRINCVVMLLRNLNINEGLCNGTRLQVVHLGNNILKCKILTGDKTGEIVFINRITLYCENVYPFTFKRRQFPIKLAFAMTINKAQGQTFDKIGIDLRKDVFNHGQLYVACSRVRSWESLKIYLGNQRENTIVKNYVYKELYM